MTVNVFPRALGLVICSVLSMQASAGAEPMTGQWERRLTTFMYVHGTGSYAPWEHPMSSNCLSEATLKTLRFLTAEGTKAAQESEGAVCNVSDTTREAGAASWRLVCSKSDGVIEDTATSVTTSESDMRVSSVLRVTGRGDSLGPDGMRSEMVMRRVGDCAGGAVPKK